MDRYDFEARLHTKLSEHYEAGLGTPVVWVSVGTYDNIIEALGGEGPDGTLYVVVCGQRLEVRPVCGDVVALEVRHG